MKAQPDKLGAVGEKVHDPGTEVGGETKVEQLPEEYVRDNCVKSMAVINKKHPDIGSSVFEVL